MGYLTFVNQETPYIMRLTTTSAALILASTLTIQAAPANVGGELAVRDTAMVQRSVDNIEDYLKTRDDMSMTELTKRESQIVTDVLTAIKNTDLAPGILKYFVTDDTLAPIVENTIVALIKNGTINIDTLLKALNDSGLAVQVIQDLISDCSFYADIYSLALGYIGDLADKLADKLTGNSKRYTMVPVDDGLVVRADDDDSNSILVSLMESLKNSGLASQVVRELIVDPDFLSFGADLIKKLFDEDAITIGQLIDALLDSGLVPSLIEAFLNLKTFDTVITNALAAAFGKCDGSSVTSDVTKASTVSVSPMPSSTGGTGVCRKKKRSYNY